MVASSLPKKSRKWFTDDVAGTCVTHFGLVYDVKRQTAGDKNGSAHSLVTTFQTLIFYELGHTSTDVSAVSGVCVCARECACMRPLFRSNCYG